ncbi:DNA polymerase III subunit delta' [Patescibacteria group bacterium]|nr:DNA polymerase III subunit delta' [Patescibacteria group bacterium]
MTTELKEKFHWPILGHQQIKYYLQLNIEDKAFSHAYLFYGPNDTGKFSMAYHFTAALLCESKNSKKPCNNCNSCDQIKKNIHPDVTIVQVQEKKQKISINQIRELQHKLSMRSFLTDYKVAIINNAELMTEESSNALLKTLEEPTNNTIFILISEHKDLLPATIQSRCQLFQFHLIPNTQIENWLILHEATKKDAKIIAHFSEGRPILAQKVKDNKFIIEQRNSRLVQLTIILKSNFNDKFQIINQLNKQASSANKQFYTELIRDWMTFFRDMLLLKNNNKNIYNITVKDQIVKIMYKFSNAAIINIINKLRTSNQALDQQANPKLVIENLVLSM